MSVTETTDGIYQRFYIKCHTFFAWHIMKKRINGPLTRYTKLRVAHAPEMPETFFPPPRVRHPDMHQGTCVTHVPCCMPRSPTSGFVWSWWRGKRSRYSRRMHNPQLCVSAKRTMLRGKTTLHSLFFKHIHVHCIFTLHLITCCWSWLIVKLI